MDEALGEVAAAQHGMFTTQQARRVGIGQDELSTMVRRRRCARLSRGLYVVAESILQGDDEAAHLQLAIGGLLLYPDAALSHESALLAHDLPVWRPRPDRAHLTRPVAHQVRCEHFVIEPWVDSVERSPVGPAVTPDHAVVQVARDRGIVSGVVAADNALHRGLTTEQRLAEVVALAKGWPYASRAESMLALADGRSESVGESRLRVVCVTAGIAVVPQQLVRDAFGVAIARLDLKIRGVKVALEFDGRVKYQDRGGQALWEEKQREDGLRALGYVVVRVTWADLENVPKLLGRINDAIRLAVQAA